MRDQTDMLPLWLTRVKSELLRDKKKTAVLAVLAAVALVLVGRAVVGRPGPARVGAAAAAVQAQPTPPPAGRPFPAGGARDDRADRDERKAYLSKLDRTIARDLFRPSEEFFPSPAGRGPEVVAVSDEQGSAGAFAKLRGLLTRSSEARRQQAQRLEAVRAKAKPLALQGVMLGDSPTALINGKVVRVGEVIDGLRIKSITADGCVVTADGIEVVLRMK